MSVGLRQEVCDLSSRILSDARSKVWGTIDANVAMLDQKIRLISFDDNPEDREMLSLLAAENQEIEALARAAQITLSRQRVELRRNHHAASAYVEVKHCR